MTAANAPGHTIAFWSDPPSIGRLACLHCGLPIDPAVPGEFCCPGCEAVYGLLHQEHLDRYYALRGGPGVPARGIHGDRRDTKWLELLQEQVCAREGPARVTLDVQGIHCMGCVWLIEELFGRMPLGERIVVNPSLGRLGMLVRPQFDLRAFVASIERFGYLFGPPVKRAPSVSRDLVARLGICSAIAMNSMIFGIAMYAGLDRGPLFSLFTTLNLGLGALSVAIGGSVFFRSALRAARQGMLHLDLPIALGIALAFLGSVHSYFARRSQGAYFDTLDVFIALMLFGRWLQERVLERNRAWLLASDGCEGLLARKVEAGRVRLVRCSDLQSSDAILVAPGDLIPVDARLQGDAASFSLDWIHGESSPRVYAAGELVPAGAFATGRESSLLRATTGFEASPLRELLRQPERAEDRARASPWWQRLAKRYVIGVLAIAGTGFAAWWLATGDLGRAAGVATAVLIVTCPCAFGIATPLAYEMVQAMLRRRGLFVRRASFLDRARSVTRVIFDKTGTLTTGELVVGNAEVLSSLDADSRQALYDLAARSSHPKSAAVREALDAYGLTIRPNVRVVEHPGLGLELEDQNGVRWRLGERSWVAPSAPPDERLDVSLARDGHIVASFGTCERLRFDAAREVQALKSEGYEVWLLSGDAQSRVQAAGDVSGIAPHRCIGDQSPHDKARFLAAHDHADSLFIGDGVNDALALDRAHTSGTPAVDRPFVPARADFFFVTAGLAPIRVALRSARALAQVLRADLAIALAYNALTVGLALAGRMSPLACAVLMPLSSLTTIAVTVAALSPRSRVWKS